MTYTNYNLNKTIYDKVLNRVLFCIKKVDPENSQTLEMICGKEFWSRLEKRDRLKVGHFIAFLVARHALPLRFGDKTGSNKQTYFAI